MASQDELIELAKPISLSIRGAIAATGFSRSRIFEMISDGRLQAVKDGSKTLILAESLRSAVQALPPARPGKAA